MTDAARYPAQVFWTDQDEGFVAVAVDLPGCSAFGESQQEAIDELQNAIRAWIKAATEAGNSIPDPSKPVEQSPHSGKLLLRMPKALHSKLAASAVAESVSLNQYIIYLLTQSQTERSLKSRSAKTSRIA